MITPTEILEQSYLHAESPHGTMFPELAVQEVLAYGYQGVHEDPTLIDDLFGKLAEKTRDDIKQYFTTHAVTVRQGLSKDSLTYPLVAIMPVSDSEDAALDALGDHLGDGMADPSSVHTVLGYGVRTELNVICLAGGDAIAASYLFYLAKAILLLNREALLAHGLHNVVVSGRDLSFRDDLLPEFAYARALGISCESHFSVTVTERVATQLQVATLTQDSQTDTTFSLDTEV